MASPNEASILDSFVIAIGIDGKGVEEGRKKAIEEFRKLREDSVASTKVAEDRNQKLANSLGNVKNEVLGLALAFAGARGVGDFALGILNNDAAVGRFSANIGMTTQAVSRWQYAVQSVGGTASDAAGSLQAMFNVIEAHRMGQNSAADNPLLRLGVTGDDAKNGPMAMLEALSENRTHLGQTDRVALMQAAGLDQNSINLLVQGKARLSELNAEADKAGTITQDDAQAAARLQAEWNKLTTTIKGEARPAITGLVEDLLALSKNTDAVSYAAPVAVGLIGAVGVASLVAYAPVAALAVVIGGLALAYERLSTAEGRSRVGANLAEDGSFVSHLWGAFHQGGDPGKTGAAIEQVFNDAYAGKYRPSSPAAPTGGGSVSGSGINVAGADADIQAYLIKRGFSAEQAKGIAAGIYAESGFNARATGPGSAAAYGLGQWIGPRKRALFAKYGPNPTPQQQMDFMVSELRGGDPGGKSVIGASDADTAMLAYIYAFMRPQGAHDEHEIDAIRDVQRARGHMYGSRLAASRHVSHRHHSEVRIDTMNVNTKATDAKGVARDMHGALKKRGLTANAPSALN